MPLETEAKFKLDNHDPLRQRLQTAGAQPRGRVLETNVIFDASDKSLSAADQALRLRTAVALDGQPDKSTMTFKGPRQPTALKTRQEFEITVDDPQKAGQIIAALGFVEILVFQKRRETWRLDPCSIELDELPDLGRFAEIEGPDEAAILAVQKKIGLTDAQRIRDTYVALLIDHCRRQALPENRVMFEN